MNARAGALAAMGKLRGFEEYVRVNANTPALVALDAWVGENMAAASKRGPDWVATYRAGRPHAFVYSTGDSSVVLAGALAPSEDNAGRAYPLFVAREIDVASAAVRSLEWLPLLLEDVWDGASRVVTEAKRDGSVSALEQLLREPRSTEASEFPRAVASWEQWTRDVSVTELAELLFDTTDAASIAGALGAVLEAVAPHRGATPPRTRLCLRLPLGRAGGAAVCFWLGVVRRAVAGTHVPSFFWTHDGEAGSLLLSVGAFPKSTLSQLWMPAPADDVLDLLDPRAEAFRSPFREPRIERALATEGASVLDLLALL
ncbi:MAG TPA: type VI secretion system-associated protein TagF [Polyangiaceae bacterium]|jgi:type VI secretion system ImpM family protein|nr:type VI secretion system-associated protein TagF [Polyangiaceae bacterium]